MADEDQVKRLNEQGVRGWNEWREQNPEIIPDLSGVHLDKRDLDHANFVDTNLSQANLVLAYLRNAKLNGADLRGANLFRADLLQADLRRANLAGAELSAADLGDANLSGANLGATELMRTNLMGANLFDADLEGANIKGANFHLANLKGANFSRVQVAFTSFGDVDLSDVRGLTTSLHVGPSEIGINTIFLSKGIIPTQFLREAGIPDQFIKFMNTLTGTSLDFYSCFISYSHADKAFAKKLHDTLQSKGVRCWLDEHQLLPGDDIYHEVDRGIRLWDKMLLCCSENSLKSWWVDNEIGTAFDKEQQLMKDRDGAKVQVLVPLNLDGYLFSDKWNSQHGYQAQVKRRLAADFTEASDAAKFDEQVERLIRALRAGEGAREKPPRARL